MDSSETNHKPIAFLLNGAPVTGSLDASIPLASAAAFLPKGASDIRYVTEEEAENVAHMAAIPQSQSPDQATKEAKAEVEALAKFIDQASQDAESLPYRMTSTKYHLSSCGFAKTGTPCTEAEALASGKPACGSCIK